MESFFVTLTSELSLRDPERYEPRRIMSPSGISAEALQGNIAEKLNIDLSRYSSAAIQLKLDWDDTRRLPVHTELAFSGGVSATGTVDRFLAATMSFE